MAHKRSVKGISLVELSVAVVIVSLLMGYAWHFYFSGRETMRHTVSQSQIQTDTRIFLDQLEAEMTSCYAFFEVDSNENSFGFYSFTYSKMSLDDILYDTSGMPLNPDYNNRLEDQKLRVVRYHYSWDENTLEVRKTRTPGWLYFLRTPMEFEEGNPDHFIPLYAPMDRVILRDIESFEIHGYRQRYVFDAPGALPRVEIFRTEPEHSVETVFIVLRLHTHKDEGEMRRDEELDIVTRFYSPYKLAESTNPGWFSTTDRDGRF